MSGLLSGVLGSLMGGGNNAGGGGVSAGGAGGMLSELFQSAGGVQGIMSKFQQAGMGDKVQSWAGQGANQPLSTNELTSVFPQGQIESFAASHGIPAGMATQLMAHLLPHAVDSQTSNGQPQADDGSAFADGQSVDPSAGTQPPSASMNAGGGGQGFNFGGLVQRLMGGE